MCFSVPTWCLLNTFIPLVKFEVFYKNKTKKRKQGWASSLPGASGQVRGLHRVMERP